MGWYIFSRDPDYRAGRTLRADRENMFSNKSGNSLDFEFAGWTVFSKKESHCASGTSSPAVVGDFWPKSTMREWGCRGAVQVS
jgi:hypothetical protein